MPNTANTPAAGAALASAATAEDAAAPTAVVGGAPAPEVEEGGWRRTLIVAGGGSIPGNVGRRKVIVTEHRGDAAYDDAGVKTADGELKTGRYAKGADLYYRTDASVEFPEDGAVHTLGDTVRVKGVGGFADRGGVRTGPGHPAYAAANLAYQQGARDIEIAGVSKADQETLSTWFASAKMPADVKITFA